MQTEVLKPVSEDLLNDFAVLKAAELLKYSETVAIPTETVYGLAANGLMSEAITKIFNAKGRPSDNPLIYHISDIEMLYNLVEYVPETALRLAETFWPGALTMIFPRKNIIPSEAVGGLETVAVRMPNHKITLALIKLCGFPLAAPSANISGSPSPTSALHVLNDMNGKIPLILDGGECEHGVESTVITFESENCARVLRPGAVTSEMLAEFTEVVNDRSVIEKLSDSDKPLSPGIKHRHYSPRAEMVLVKAESNNDFNLYVSKRLNLYKTRVVFALVFDDENPPECRYLTYGRTDAEQARSLFAKLRELDGLNAEIVFIRAPAEKGLGMAVYNRLIRASDFNVTDLRCMGRQN